MAEADIGPRESGNHRKRGQDETNASDEQAGQAGALIADVNGKFAGTGAGDETAGAEQIEKFFAR